MHASFPPDREVCVKLVQNIFIGRDGPVELIVRGLGAEIADTCAASFLRGGKRYDFIRRVAFAVIECAAHIGAHAGANVGVFEKA